MRTTVPAAAMALLCLLAVLPATGIATQPPGVADGKSSTATPAALSADAVDSASTAPVSASSVTATAPAEASTAPPDPAEDTLGWENGRWYNESIVVDASDGLNRTESARLLNRTMARVERLRKVEFHKPVDLNFRTRSEYAKLANSGLANLNATAMNVRYEALGIVGERTNAVNVRRKASTGFAAAFVVTRDRPIIDLQKGDVTIITQNDSATYQEWVLGHELVHTLQVQELDAEFGRNTSNRDDLSGTRSLIEGDANYVTYRYLQRCREQWSCVTPEQERAKRSFGPVFAMNALNTVWYSNGAQLVADLYREGGWEAVNEAHQSPPASTEQVIHPDKYGVDAPQSVSVADRSNDEWEPLTTYGKRVGYTVGEAGLFTMLWYPSARADKEVIIPMKAWFNRSQPAPHPYDYDHRLSAGWDGDRLVPYVSPSAAANETGYVWRIEWDTPEDAREFADAYRLLLEHRGATAVEGRESTFRIPDSKQFGDAYHVNQTGTTVVLVNAPSVEDIADIRAGAAPAAATPTPTPTPTPMPTSTLSPTPTRTPTASPTATAMPTDAPTATPTPSTTGGSGPGFGVLAAVLGVVLGFLVSRRRP